MSKKNIFFNEKKNNINLKKKISIVIDPGHGGEDPGAVGYGGLQEKNININIALKIKKLFINNKQFDITLTRNNDTYISLKKRKQYLKKKHFNLLISIHVNSSKKKNISGASIWMVSKNRMHREIANHLNNKKDIVFFSKKIEDILNENKYDFFLKKTILDLQFNNFQKIGIDLSNCISKELKKATQLNKINLYYASLGILSSINTPSLLIETGFITNFSEEKKLKTTHYQNKIAYSIYIGLKKYFINELTMNKKSNKTI